MRRGGLGLTLFLALMPGACSKAVEDVSVAEPAPVVVDVISLSMTGRGEAIAELACAQCHAIGDTGDSAHPDAPPFRLLGRTVDLSTLPERFAEGNITSHPGMPNWQFEAVDMEGLIAYLEEIQATEGK